MGNLPIRNESKKNLIDDRNGGRVARREPVGSPTPVHQADELKLAQNPGREECWWMLSARVRQRLADRSGDTIEWAAWLNDDEPRRVCAVVLGDRGLCFADPRIAADGRKVYELPLCSLDPASFRRVQIEHRPTGGAGSSTSGPSASGPSFRNSSLPTVPPGLSALGDRDLGILGNLPPQAQELLQAPFIGGDQVLRCSWYYYGREHKLGLFLFLLAGKRHITAAFGTREIPAGLSSSAAHWSLTCLRADVTSRAGLGG